MTLRYYTLLAIVSLSTHCFAADKDTPCNSSATKETVNLYRNLKKLSLKGFMFGHQDDLAYGVNWRYEPGNSDIKTVVDDYPAVYGWDLGGIELGQENNLDGIPFKKMKQFIKESYERGGVTTISWHARSPIGAEKGAWDTTRGTVASILPGGNNHELYKTWLDKIALFITSLKGNKGESIPVLFRPFHELTGNWFWWCRNTCSEFEFRTLWRFTVCYLQQEKKLNNLLWVYNTSDNINTAEDFLQRYPGDDMVDMLSLDAYQYDDPQKNDGFVIKTAKLLKLIDSIAQEKGKLSAFAETGYEAIPYPEWWTRVLLKAIGNAKISYVLVWRNHGYAAWNQKMHYYAPYKGQVSADDFKKFFDLPNTFFGRDAAGEKLYGP
ncbi:MAG: glycosyl hydrolase [Chitinophagaceae bacterium]